MPDFRYTAITSEGRKVQGFINAKSKQQANKALNVISSRKNISVRNLEKQKKYIYKAKNKYGESVKGELKAYSKDELQEALENLDYTDIKIEKKILGSLFNKISNSEITRFLGMCSDLLKENLAFEEILNLIASDTDNLRMKGIIREIIRDLKEGKEGKEVFGKHKDVFGDFPAYMMGIAVESGNMKEIFKNTATFLERDQEFKKKIRQALIMPIFTILIINVAIIYYVLKIFPATAQLFIKMNKEVPEMTAATLSVRDFLVNNWILLLIAILVPIFGILLWGRTEKGKYYIDKFKLKIPVIGKIMHKNSIEVFARVFHSLYSGSGANIEAIKIASEACRNYYIERQIKDVAIPLMLKEGKGLVESFGSSGVFTRAALSRFRAGEQSGSLRMNAKQLANFYATEVTYSMDRFVNVIQISVSLVITVAMLFLTLVSSETVMIQ
ncbi:MAG: type II secretion system F family protein [Candidatus Marinimicrobia bacterium]|nr:type II secretion system F family protein [Candidatus Neomarinimicrobiota bacterium]